MYSDKKMYTVDYNATCGFLKHLNAEELRGVLNDDEKFEDMIKDLKQAKDMETEKEMLLASNRSLAEFNLTREPEMVSVKKNLLELGKMGESLYKSVEEKSSKLNSYNRSRNIETILALLQTAAAEMEEESENVAESFLNGETDVDRFLEQFTSRRKLMHLRRVKADKMSEMVRYRINRMNFPAPAVLRNSNAQNYPSFYQPPPPIAAVPYPLGPTNAMPLPSYSLQSQF